MLTAARNKGRNKGGQRLDGLINEKPMDALGDFFPITADGSTTWTLMQNRSLRNEIRFFKETPSFWLVLVVLCQARMIPSHRNWNDRLGDLWIRKWSFVCHIEKA